MDIQDKASKIWAELECEPTGELALVHSNSAIKTYVFSAENMEKLENSYRQVCLEGVVGTPNFYSSLFD